MVRLGIEERTLRVSEDQRSSTNGSVVLPYSSTAKDEKSSETNEETYGHYNTHKITRTERIVFVSFFVYSSKSKESVCFNLGMFSRAQGSSTPGPQPTCVPSKVFQRSD